MENFHFHPFRAIVPVVVFLSLTDLSAAPSFGSDPLAGGTYQVGLSRTYIDLGAVSAALAGNLVLGDLVFELQDDYFGAITETFPIVFTPFTSAGGNWTVTIRPASGVTTSLTSGGPPPYQPVIHLNGARNITIDGRQGGAGSAADWTVRNARTDSAGPAILISNGAEGNALRFLRVESQCSTASYGTITFGRPGDALGVRRNAVSHSIVRDRTDAVGGPQIAIAAVSLDAARHDSNEVTANDLFNWKSRGMLLAGDHWKVDSNSLYSTLPRTAGLTGIQFTGGEGHLVADNAIGGGAAGAGGAPLVHQASAPFTGILLVVDTNETTIVERNTVRNVMLSSSGFANFFGISGQSLGRLLIRGNVIGDTAAGMEVVLSGTGVAAGVILQFLQGATVEGNIISGIRQQFPMPGELRAISLNSPNAFTIARNRIFHVGPTRQNVPGLVRGIFLDVFIDSALVANNMVSLGFGDTNDVQYDCLYDVSTSGMVRVSVVNNSFAVGGAAQFSASSSGVNHSGASLIRLRNNAVANLRSGGGGFHHAFNNFSPSWFPAASDNNVLMNLAPGQLNKWMGAPMSLAAWVIASTGDAATVFADPGFVDLEVGDLHIDSTVFSAADNAGVALANVTHDYDAQLRGGAPDIGADEYVIASPGSFALLAPVANAHNQPVAGALAWSSSSAAGAYDLYLDTLSPPAAVLATGLADTSYAYSGLDTNREYYWKVVAGNSSGNVAAGGSPRKFTTGPGGGPVTITCEVDSDWNIVSLPVMVSDAYWLSVYANAVSRAYAYAGNYQPADTLRCGSGYWVQCSDTSTISITGATIDTVGVAVLKGWNIIGGVSSPVATASVTSEPGGLVTSNFYRYDPDGYHQSDTLLPGRGYWVKVGGNGVLVIDAEPVAAPGARIRIQATNELPPGPPRDAAGSDNGRDSGAGWTVPDRYAVAQNYPNPFNSTTVVRLLLPERSVITAMVYDILGSAVATVADGERPAGVESIIWSGTRDGGVPLPSGVYLLRIGAVSVEGTGNSFGAALRLVLIR